MRENIKYILLIVVLALALGASYGFPRVKYRSPEILSKLEIPLRTSSWIGKDVSGDVNPNDLRYNFISEVFTRAYVNRYGESLLFLILDAGNFHNPKVCFGGSGFKVKDLPDTELKVGNHTWKAKTVFFHKPRESYVIMYWISINKKVVGWTGQKILQLWYSLLNRQKISLMVRLDIPATEDTISSATKLAQEFLDSISPYIPQEHHEYLFGK